MRRLCWCYARILAMLAVSAKVETRQLSLGFHQDTPLVFGSAAIETWLKAAPSRVKR